MKHIDLSKMLNWLGFVLNCPICNHKYNFQNIKVLESSQDDNSAQTQLLIHSNCQKCKSSVMFNIDITGTEVYAVAAVTDLTSADTTKFQ